MISLGFENGLSDFPFWHNAQESGIYAIACRIRIVTDKIDAKSSANDNGQQQIA